MPFTVSKCSSISLSALSRPARNRIAVCESDSNVRVGLADGLSRMMKLSSAIVISQNVVTGPITW